VRVGFASDGKDMLRPQADEPMIRSGKMPEDWSSLAPELKKQEHDLLITKRQWGAFYGTELDLELRRRGITTIVLCGIATNLAVESTARAAFERAYNLVFASDAIASFSEEEHNFPITRIFPRIGRVRKTEEIIASLHTY
jgi:nicotinamidase-related amidase